MSYAIGGRSGNRGQCAQPCRLKYSLVDANGNLIADKRYLLSLRDLNLSHSMGELVDAGVCSFKIEGRLKNKAYVMNVVGYYRQLLDHILNERGIRASSSGKVKLDFTPNPSKTFNRGYTTFFLHGRDKNITSMDTPKSTGEPLGAVDSISKGNIKLKNADVQLHPGDGLCYFDVQHEIMGTYVNAVNAKGFRVDQPQGLRPGTPLFRNFDHDFLSQVNKSHPKRKIQVDFKIEKTIEGIKLIAKDEDGCYAEIAITTRLTTADAPDKSLKIINRQLKKLGSTAFSCTKVECDISPIPFFPVSTLNKLRRSVIENLAESRKQNFPRWHHKIVPNNEPYPKNQLSFEANVLNKKAETFYRRHGVQVIEQAAEAHHEMTGRRVMTTKHCLRYEFNACPRQKNAETPALPWTLIDEHGNEFPLQFNCAYCEMEVYFRKLPE